MSSVARGRPWATHYPTAVVIIYTTNVLVKGVFVRLSSVLGADSYAGSPGSSLGDGTTREHACDGVRRYLETLAEGS